MVLLQENIILTKGTGNPPNSFCYHLSKHKHSSLSDCLNKKPSTAQIREFLLVISNIGQNTNTVSMGRSDYQVTSGTPYKEQFCLLCVVPQSIYIL